MAHGSWLMAHGSWLMYHVSSVMYSILRPVSCTRPNPNGMGTTCRRSNIYTPIVPIITSPPSTFTLPTTRHSAHLPNHRQKKRKTTRKQSTEKPLYGHLNHVYCVFGNFCPCGTRRVCYRRRRRRRRRREKKSKSKSKSKLASVYLSLCFHAEPPWYDTWGCLTHTPQVCVRKTTQKNKPRRLSE